MAHQKDKTRKEGVSAPTDALASELLGDALDALAAGEELGVVLVTQDASGDTTALEVADDDPEKCILAARDYVRSNKGALRYAIAYEGAVEDDAGVFQDAVLLEFGERGYKAYSAFSLVSGKGEGDDFVWTEAAPAGEMEPLL